MFLKHHLSSSLDTDASLAHLAKLNGTNELRTAFCVGNGPFQTVDCPGSVSPVSVSCSFGLSFCYSEPPSFQRHGRASTANVLIEAGRPFFAMKLFPWPIVSRGAIQNNGELRAPAFPIENANSKDQLKLSA